MSKISKSPNRHTFQRDNYIKRTLDEGKEISEEYLDMWKSAQEQDEENMINPDWQKDNLEYDLRSTDWILEKARESTVYSQNLYAAMCNREFQRLQVMPILTDQRWSCSWRHAGGIVADMREEGDYIEWYCSGIQNHTPMDPIEFNDLTEDQQLSYKEREGYVPESGVTDEIREDLKKLGWIILDDNE